MSKKDIVIEEIKQVEYNNLCIEGKVKDNVLYIIYADKRKCIICGKEYKRYNEFESKIFCPDCILSIRKIMKGDKK